MAKSLLVIGYSGKSDAAFDELAKSYAGENRIYWCDHDESPNADVQKLIDSGHSYVEHLGKCDADQFLIDLALELECFPPKLIKDPFGHLLEELESVNNYPLSDSNNIDILKNLKDRLDTAKEAERSGKENIEMLMIKNNWQAVIEIADPKNENHKEILCWAYLMQADEVSNVAKKNSRRAKKILEQQP